jgi:hypothetical protein
VYLRDFESRQARQHHNQNSPLAGFQPPRGKRSRKAIESEGGEGREARDDDNQQRAAGEY